MRFVLDTNILIGGGVRLEDGDQAAISTISLAELHFGVLRASNQAERAIRLQRLAAVERSFNALPVDERVAASYGFIADAVAAAGRQPRTRQFDLLIAATAHAHGATVLTSDLADFAGLRDLVDVRAAP